MKEGKQTQAARRLAGHRTAGSSGLPGGWQAAAAHAGDDEGNLLWRLQAGELYTANPPKVAVLELTGNNDLSDADCRFNKTDIDYAVPGTIQRCARAPRMHAAAEF